MKIVAVIPAYNEATTVGSVVESVSEQVDEVIVVDDGSIDQTGPNAQKAGAIVIRHFFNRGQGAALQTGFEYALRHEADIVVTFDADGQFEAAEIKKVVEPLLLDKVDVVLGSRFLTPLQSVPLKRKILLKAATAITRLYTGLAVTDAHNGFRALSRQALSVINLQQRGMAHASEILEEINKHRLRFMEVPITVNYTDYSLQKGQRLSSSFRIVKDLFVSRLFK